MKLLLSSVLIGIVLTGAIYGEQASNWEPSTMVDGEPYHSVDELRSFYKLSTGIKSTRKGAYAIGNSDVSVELGSGAREMRIGGILVELVHPMHKTPAGEWLISREDWIASIDPILRPTYIQDRQTVQTVVIDAGHGGHDTGEVSGQLNEAEIALQMARKLQTALEKMGYKTILTRTEGKFLSDQQRVELANAAGPNAIFLSLHINGGRSDFRGSSVYTLAPGQDNRPGHVRQSAHAALAYALQSAMVSRAGTADAGCKRAHYSLLSSITCPAAWIELGYATHSQEGISLTNAAYQDTLAQALAQGVATYAAVANPAAKIPVQTPPPRVPVKHPVATPTKNTSTTDSGTRGGSASTRGNSARGGSTARNSSRQQNTRQQSSSARQQQNSRQQQSSGARRQNSPSRTRR